MMIASPWPLFALAALLAGASYKELSSFGGKHRSGFPVLPLLLFLGFAVYAMVRPGWIPATQLVGLTIFGMVVAPLFVKRQSKILLEIGSCWFLGPLISLGMLQAFFYSPEHFWQPASPVLLIVLPIWVGDSLAYVIGKKFGKHLLAPKISPKKTMEGAVANLVGCVSGALVVGALIHAPIWLALICGVVSGVFGQAGDLYESSLKRSAGLKDAGSLLPGHGGILDRIDSLLAIASLEALLLISFWPVHPTR